MSERSENENESFHLSDGDVVIISIRGQIVRANWIAHIHIFDGMMVVTAFVATASATGVLSYVQLTSSKRWPSVATSGSRCRVQSRLVRRTARLRSATSCFRTPASSAVVVETAELPSKGLQTIRAKTLKS